VLFLELLFAFFSFLNLVFFLYYPHFLSRELQKKNKEFEKLIFFWRMKRTKECAIHRMSEITVFGFELPT